jgi:hypothetical protein
MATALRNTLTALVAPALFPATAIANSNTLSDLISAYETASAEYTAADDEAAAIFARPDRPAWPHVKIGELDSRYWFSHSRDNALTNREDIAKLFDREMQSIAWHAQQFWNNEAVARRTAETEVERTRTLAHFDERQEAYDTWERSSGLLATRKRVSELARLVDSIEDQICRFQVRSLEDVQTVARFMLDHEPRGLDGDYLIETLRAFAA